MHGLDRGGCVSRLPGGSGPPAVAALVVRGGGGQDHDDKSHLPSPAKELQPLRTGARPTQIYTKEKGPGGPQN